MRRHVVIGTIALLVGGCASAQERTEWQSHSSHFASWDHLVFSVKNRFRPAKAEVTADDGKGAGQDKWWGLYELKDGQDLTPKD